MAAPPRLPEPPVYVMAEPPPKPELPQPPPTPTREELLAAAQARYEETLLYGVKASDAVMLALPAIVIFVATLLASLPAVIRAVRIDPVAMLRAE